MAQNAWKCLVTLQWLTGDDGRVAFWKIAFAVMTAMFGVVVWHIVDNPKFTDTMWPLLWMFALFLAAGFGLKGLNLWFQKATMGTTTNITQTDSVTRVDTTATPPPATTIAVTAPPQS